MSIEITVVWRAFDTPIPGRVCGASRTIRLDGDLAGGLGDEQLCEQVFAQTNLYEGQIWDALQPLPPERTHTSLSVVFGRGDLVVIDGRVWQVAPVGFERLDALPVD